MRMSVLATVVWASEKMKHVEASDIHAATRNTGRPPSRHCAPIHRPRTACRTTARNSAANELRQRLVVHRSVLTRRTMSPPLLQHSAAAATKRAPRRADGAAAGRSVTGGSDAGRDGEREEGALADLALDPDRPAVQLDELPAQGEPQPGALAPGRAGRHLAELLEHGVLILGRDTDARVGDRDLETAVRRDGPDLDPAALRRELDRVGQEIEHDLLDLALVGADLADPLVDGDPQRDGAP